MPSQHAGSVAISVESIVEYLWSPYTRNRQSKKRTPTDDRSNHEMLIAFNFNGPSLVKLYIVLESALNKYFRKGPTHLKYIISKAIDTKAFKQSKLPFMDI